MTKLELIQHFEDSQKEYLKNKDKQYIKENSIFFTPNNVSYEMIKTIDLDSYKDLSCISILEPSAGCGALILSTCLFLIENTKIKNIKVEAFELNNDLCNLLDKNLRLLIEYINLNTDVTIDVKVFNKNFILFYSHKWNDSEEHNLFNLIISNPPYNKISKSSEEAKCLCDVVYGQPNIYALFIALSLKLLKKDGTYILLSPRNYLVGEYTKKLRRYIFKEYCLRHVHSFTNRNIFKYTNQEVIISTFIKDKSYSKTSLSHDGKLQLEAEMTSMILDRDNLTLMIPKSSKDIELLKKFSKFTSTLNEFSIKISVGPIVQFRNEGLLSKEIYFENYAPLLISNDIRSDNKIYYFERKNTRKTHNKSISIKAKHLIPNTNYLILRKVTAKDDKDTIILSVLEKDYFNHKWIGLDNNLLYFHKIDRKVEVSREECFGLFCYLNSTYFEQYYSLINGTHTINVSDFRNIRFPSIETILSMGKKLISLKKYDKITCSYIMDEYL